MHKVAAFIDYENIHIGMDQQFRAVPEPRKFAELLSSALAQKGEVLIAKAYAGWEDFPDLQAELKKKRIEPNYVLTKKTTGVDKQGKVYQKSRKNSADIALCLDAQELLFARPEIDTFIFVTGDRDFLDITSRCKSRGKQVLIFGVTGTISQDLEQNADEIIAVEELFGIKAQKKNTDLLVKEHALDLTAFVRRVNELEKSLAFVGLKYFCREILEPSCAQGKEKEEARAILNEVIEKGIVITYKVNNPRGSYPATAIKLDRTNPTVQDLLSELEKAVENSNQIRHS